MILGKAIAIKRIRIIAHTHKTENNLVRKEPDITYFKDLGLIQQLEALGLSKGHSSRS